MSIFSAAKLSSLIQQLSQQSQREWTLRDVAEEVQISPSYLSLLLNGKRTNPAMDVVMRMKDLFSVELEELFEVPMDQDIRLPVPLSIPDEQMEAQRNLLFTVLTICRQLLLLNNNEQALEILTLLPEQRERDEWGIERALLLTLALLKNDRLTEAGEQLGRLWTGPALTPHQQAHARFLQGTLAVHHGDAMKGVEHLQAARELAETSDPKEAADLLFRIHMELGTCLFQLDSVSMGLSHYEQSLRYATDSLPALELALLQMRLGVAWYQVRHAPASQRALREAQSIFEQEGDLKRSADCLHMLALVDLLAGRHEAAIDFLQHSLHTHQQARDHFGAGLDLCALARCFWRLERWQEMRDYAQRAQVTFENSNQEQHARIAHLLFLAASQKTSGVTADLCADLELLCLEFYSQGKLLDYAHALRIQSDCLKERGHADLALAHCLEALRVYEECHAVH